MKHAKRKAPRLGFFASHWRRALDYQRERNIKKTLECIQIKKENDELWDVVCKQRLALDALQKGHEKDMAEMSESLRKTHVMLAAAEADRDRYRDALRRAFPGKEEKTA